MKIYLAGSWKNANKLLWIREQLEAQNHIVDCFASEINGRISFNWNKLVNIQQHVNIQHFLYLMDAKDMLEIEQIKQAFAEDKRWINWCEVCILVLPSGKSAHLEAGYAKGQGKKLFIFGNFPKGKFEVMYGFADGMFREQELPELLKVLNE